MSQAHEIRLVVHRDEHDGTYTARWFEPDGQESEPFSLVLPLSVADMFDLRWYLEEYLQFTGFGDRVRAQGIHSKLTTWGENLFEAIFGGSQGTHVYRNLIDAADGEATCLLTLGTIDPKILAQPWEMIRDPGGPLAFRRVTIRRQLVGSRKTRPHKLQLPLRVLLVVSRPSDVDFLDPRNSIRPVLEAIEGLPEDQVELEFCEPPTLGQLETILSEAYKAKRPYHVVHFDGHGCFMPETGVGALAFERDDMTRHLVTGRQLGDLLVQQSVPLVLLEACRTADLSDVPVFGSVAPALLQARVGSVIAFSHSVHVEAARLLVERFYRELLSGATIGAAVQQARQAMHASPARFLHYGPNAASVDLEDWFSVQLYQVGRDPALIRDGRPTTAKPRGRTDVKARLHGDFPPPPMYQFHGRARELLDLQRALRRHPAVVLAGGGGMGKTALAREAALWWLRTGRFQQAVFCSFEQKAGPEQVVQTLGRALEGDQFSSRPAEEQWHRAVELFHSQAVLLIWDNFESTLPTFQQGEETGAPLGFDVGTRDQLLKLYRELTEDEPAGRLLVTCRPEETGLPGIKQQSLGRLWRPDSLYLLAAVLDIKDISTERPGYERQEIDDLLKMLDDHPLSIELVAPHLKTLLPQTIRDEFAQLLDQFTAAAATEGRNRSLLASLEFSKRRLSPTAQNVLPYLAWFEGGVFEQFLLDFTELEAEAFAAVRAELLATALLSIETPPEFTAPYLRFHPTLPYAARAGEVPDPQQAQERFIGVYLRVMNAADEALRGSEPAAGMVLVAREEANLRAAMARAFQAGQRHEGGALADTLGVYLQMAGRLRERDALVRWVHDRQPQGEILDKAACASILYYAISRLSRGHAEEAVKTVQSLIARLETEGLAGGEDATFQTAMAYHYLGRIFVEVRRPDLALEPGERAIALFEGLSGDPARGNLAVALTVPANAYMSLGRLDEALETAERGLAIDRELGHDRSIAADLTRIAAILTDQHRYGEAEARYGEALDAARAAGDLGLQGAILQHQGTLQRRMGDHDRAVERYQQAITLFQQAGNHVGEMQTCDLLGTAEARLDHLDAAEAWYARSRELALQLKDRPQVAATAQNVGILYQTRAKQAAEGEARAALLRQAVAAVQESLAIKLEMQDRVGAASSYGQLGVLHGLLDQLDEAEKHAREALAIDESLNLPDVYKDYANLAEIARARGDSEAAEQWQAKCDAKEAELEQLARGALPPGY